MPGKSDANNNPFCYENVIQNTLKCVSVNTDTASKTANCQIKSGLLQLHAWFASRIVGGFCVSSRSGLLRNVDT